MFEHCISDCDKMRIDDVNDILYDREQPTNTTGDDELLTIPIIKKLCNFCSIILAGT